MGSGYGRMLYKQVLFQLYKVEHGIGSMDDLIHLMQATMEQEDVAQVRMEIEKLEKRNNHP